MANENKEVLKARLCYGHLGGTLGGRLFQRLIEIGWFEPEEGTRSYRVTDTGMAELCKLGVDIFSKK